MQTKKKVIARLEEELLRAWQSAHGVKTGKASALVGSERLAILIDDAFSRAERKMAEAQAGEMLLRQYALELLNQICNETSLNIELEIGRKIRSREVNVNLDANQVMFVFRFEPSDP